MYLTTTRCFLLCASLATAGVLDGSVGVQPIRLPGVGKPVEITSLDEEDTTIMRRGRRGKEASQAPEQAPAPVVSKFDSPNLQFLSDADARMQRLEESVIKDMLMAAVMKLTAATYKVERTEHTVEEQDAVSGLKAESDVESSVLQLCSEATTEGFEVLKYDIYHRPKTNLLKGEKREKTPQEALDLAQELIDYSTRLRHEFMDMLNGSVKKSLSKISLLSADKATTTTSMPLAELPLYMAVSQVSDGEEKNLLLRAYDALEAAQNREGHVHRAEKKNILAGLKEESKSTTVMSSCREAKHLARQAQTMAISIPLKQRGARERVIEEVAQRIMGEAQEVQHEYMMSVRSSVGDLMKAVNLINDAAAKARQQEEQDKSIEL
mmetsp:Transcript_14105/g.31286  ORF Transcript_14105/g.31286 Transcript_14105/m.31286 type:complete len:380 (+) Transcript_14105:143-1282(+)|eukprot:CAMPEP_0204269162 /NCGR_PEP_ID=MMETSP0468-20130131/15615_1 /ASSEMBLY_ACC=CAM_ASM_000383 /TAXON_ID=2969 /ORGANISM="Oxyrrhis marina" /LENGTH=379 /DNA_ID=CAMNT_0051244517 /DNA_START=126 /DNA_END=1265 /DNA_ORIENTATION=-